jgi:hypothetical protein
MHAYYSISHHAGVASTLDVNATDCMDQIALILASAYFDFPAHGDFFQTGQDWM